jgi:hypothetical protein
MTSPGTKSLLDVGQGGLYLSHFGRPGRVERM